MKECSNCLTKKPLHEFGARKLKSGHITTRSHCLQCENQRCREYYNSTREKRLMYRKEYNKQYYLKNTVKIKSTVKIKKKQLESRTPEWLSQAHRAEIEAIYQFAGIMGFLSGEPYHVDHMIPVRGKLVSGLHVPWNLSAIPAVENIVKSNHFTTS